MHSTPTPDTSNPGVSASRGGAAAPLESMASYAAPAPPVDPHHLNHASKAKLARFYRAQRWAQRDTMRRLLPGTSCAKCGRPVSKATGIGLYWDENHGARFAGLRTCGSVWCCPVCNAKIQAYRQKELQSALDAAKSRGWGLVFGTLTLRHQLGDPLDKVRDMCQKVWRSVQQQKGTRRLLDSLGLQGYIRAMEVTFSNANGWHVHLHVYWLFSHPLTPDQLDSFRTDYVDRWISAVDRVNARASKQDPTFKPFAAPLPANQLFKSVRLTATTIRTYSKYTTLRKTVAPSGRSAVWRASQELTNTQSKIGKVKSHNGKSVLHLNFWDFLSILHDLGYGTSAYKTRLSAANACYVRLAIPVRPCASVSVVSVAVSLSPASYRHFVVSELIGIWRQPHFLARLVLDCVMDFMPDGSYGDTEHSVPGFHQFADLGVAGAFIHVLSVAHDGDVFKLRRIAPLQISDGRRHVLQVHAHVKQPFGHGKHQDVLE